MSSIRCKVTALVPAYIYEGFAEGRFLLLKTYETKEFGDIFYAYTKDDYTSIEVYYDVVMNDLKHFEASHRLNELEDKAFEYAKKMTLEDFKMLLNCGRNDHIAQIDPITIDYSHYYRDGKEHKTTYDYLTASDIFDIIFYWSDKVQRPEVYFYDGWAEDIENIMKLKNVDTDEEYYLIVRNEEC